MKSFFACAALSALAVCAGAQQTGQQNPGSGARKVIYDKTEYNAYITALNTQDPAARALAMESFAAQYPHSVVFTDALEQAMAAYQQAGNQARVLEIARRLLQLGPNIRALAIVTALDRAQATSTGDTSARKEGCADARMGLQQLPAWSKPEDMSDTDFAKLKTQMAGIFDGAAGFCALQDKDYAAAHDAYTKAFETDPANFQDVYQLAVADLEQNPMDVDGLWYCAKAIALAHAANNGVGVNAITPYCKAKYRKYHGGEDGWDQLVESAESANVLPANFPSTVKRAPTPCELAVEAVQQNDPAAFSFSDREFILSKADCSPANKDAAGKVWHSIQAMEKEGKARLSIPAKVIAATADTLELAISDENQTANTADMKVAMEKPLAQLPAVGSKIEIVGEITGYKAEPFSFEMEHGELGTPKAAGPASQP